jgi:hypothetical protein
MFNPTYRDLCHLRNVLKLDMSDNSSYLLGQIETEINRVDDALLPCCLSNRRPGFGRDIYYLNERQTYYRLQIAAREGPESGPRSILIVCDSQKVAEAVFGFQVTNEFQLERCERNKNSATLKNGQTIDVIGRSDSRKATCGRSYDLTIVYTGAD